VGYCVLAAAAAPLAPAELDARCEALLSSRFGLRVDFRLEEALPQLLAWGLAEATPGGGVRALAPAQALPALDAAWDAVYDFDQGGSGAAAAAPAAGAKPAVQAAGAAAALTPESGKKKGGMLGRLVRGVTPS
jgi:hypothetical protein